MSFTLRRKGRGEGAEGEIGFFKTTAFNSWMGSFAQQTVPSCILFFLAKTTSRRYFMLLWREVL